MLAALAAVSLLHRGPSVSDYFPLVPGTMRTFEEQGVSTTVTVDEVGKPVDIGGKPAVPVKTREGSKLVNTTYYRVEGNTVFIVAYDPKHPLPNPMPVLQFDGGLGKWNFDGPSTDDDKTAERIVLDGTAKTKGTRDVLGHKVAVIEARMTAAMGGGLAQEKVEQIATYAEGIGLVELVSKTRVNKRSVTTTLRLVKVEEAKNGG